MWEIKESGSAPTFKQKKTFGQTFLQRRLKGIWLRYESLKRYEKRKQNSSFEVCTLKEILLRVYLFWIRVIYYWGKVINMNASKMKNYSEQLFLYETKTFISKHVKSIRHMNKQNQSYQFWINPSYLDVTLTHFRSNLKVWRNLLVQNSLKSGKVFALAMSDTTC